MTAAHPHTPFPGQCPPPRELEVFEIWYICLRSFHINYATTLEEVGLSDIFDNIEPWISSFFFFFFYYKNLCFRLDFQKQNKTKQNRKQTNKHKTKHRGTKKSRRWRSHWWGVRGQSAPPSQRKICQKSGKRGGN